MAPPLLQTVVALLPNDGSKQIIREYKKRLSNYFHATSNLLKSIKKLNAALASAKADQNNARSLVWELRQQRHQMQLELQRQRVQFNLIKRTHLRQRKLKTKIGKNSSKSMVPPTSITTKQSMLQILHNFNSLYN